MNGTHDDDDAHVDASTDGAAIFSVGLYGFPAPDILKRAAWNGLVFKRTAEYANRRGESVPIDGTALARIGREWDEAVQEIRALREQLGISE